MIVASLAMAFFASHTEAQGALSVQGLGYPTGQTSARAEGMGGASADFDPLSLVSPASMAAVGAAAVFFQYSPEFRRVTTGSSTANTTTARFPLVSGILPVGQSWTVAVSSSTFLDRSSETSLVLKQNIGGPTDSVTETEQNKVLGAINDVRFALGWAGSQKIHFGVGAHIFSGSNRITLSHLFPDSTAFVSTSQSGRLSFAGYAASAGLEFRPSRVIGFSISGRKGGDLRAESGDTAIGKARIPDHYSASVSYEGITGAVISARAAHDAWSSLSSLSSSGARAFDGWDYSVGAEVTGPRILNRIVAVRTGARFRTLPFGFNGEKVTENSFMAGLGFPLAGNRAGFDFALQRAARSTTGDIKERGIILSFGLRVSP